MARPQVMLQRQEALVQRVGGLGGASSGYTSTSVNREPGSIWLPTTSCCQGRRNLPLSMGIAQRPPQEHTRPPSGLQPPGSSPRGLLSHVCTAQSASMHTTHAHTHRDHTRVHTPHAHTLTPHKHTHAHTQRPLREHTHVHTPYTHLHMHTHTPHKRTHAHRDHTCVHTPHTQLHTHIYTYAHTLTPRDHMHAHTDTDGPSPESKQKPDRAVHR